MPFIKDDLELRIKLDKITKHIITSKIQFNGDFNYILYQLAKYYIKHSYGNIKNMLSELHEAEEYIRYKFLYPYEEKKKKENGDVNFIQVDSSRKLGVK